MPSEPVLTDSQITRRVLIYALILLSLVALPITTGIILNLDGDGEQAILVFFGIVLAGLWVKRISKKAWE